ncbi:MAG: hypothetical protein LUG27_10180 [Clostridiales bacterium]|nr:hypothetical protein [Clostridiales bacterium]
MFSRPLKFGREAQDSESLYYDYTGKSITIFALMLQTEKEAAAEIGKSDLVMWMQVLSGWLPLLLPLLLSFGYLVTLSSERQSGETGFQLIRMGNFRYSISKLTGGALAGGIGFTAGYGIFGLVMMSVFPGFSAFPQDEQTIWLQLYGGGAGITIFVVKRLLGIFLYGMFACVFGLGAAILIRDKYMLLCLPFLLNYIYIQVLQRLLNESFSGAGDRTELISAFFMDSVVNISGNRYWYVSMFFMLTVYAGLFVAFYMEVQRRGCNG